MQKMEGRDGAALLENRRGNRGKNNPGGRDSRIKGIDELKFSSNAVMSLGLTRECVASLYNCSSFLDFQYMEYILENNLKVITGEDEESRVQFLMMVFLKFRLNINGNNILHILPTHEKFLQFYSKIAVTLADECEFPEAESYFFSVVYPNNQGLTPFDIAIKEKSSKSIEIMLDMLQKRPQYNFSKYVQKHFHKLFEMNSVSFERFFEGCTFKIGLSFKNSWAYQKDSR